MSRGWHPVSHAGGTSRTSSSSAPSLLLKQPLFHCHFSSIPFPATLFSLYNHRGDLQRKVAATKAALSTRTWLLSAHLPRGCWKASTSSTHSLWLPSTPALMASYRPQGTARAEAQSASPLCCPTVSQVNLQTAPASNVAMARGGLLQDADFQELLILGACSSLETRSISP